MALDLLREHDDNGDVLLPHKRPKVCERCCEGALGGDVLQSGPSRLDVRGVDVTRSIVVGWMLKPDASVLKWPDVSIATSGHATSKKTSVMIYGHEGNRRGAPILRALLNAGGDTVGESSKFRVFQMLFWSHLCLPIGGQIPSN